MPMRNFTNKSKSEGQKKLEIAAGVPTPKSQASRDFVRSLLPKTQQAPFQPRQMDTRHRRHSIGIDYG
ncbi:uncharacterized protein ColSpa_12810 [Colletotrichum spaethianum]|uniref:Uncharacterized protein n=1 Tax=Colletotrichum spaethianum TaxID=700344 RepID=A0AA37PI59_9PEZI|nr:uncharacterized protein ColSpa_12810 [Colletotrichum spaethianum]GKT52629.1 hypothetical protein ColSpa_12810 [Colletotrichum spaethianum]